MKLHDRRWSSRAAVTAAALLGAGITVLPAPAQAVDPVPAPVLQWEISQQFDDHLSTHTYTGGAAEDAAGVVSFPDGVGSYNAANGTATVAYSGSVRGAFVNSGNEFYSVTFADPIVTVAGNGDGTVSAVVSSTVTGPPASSTSPARVVVTTFTAGTADWVAGAPYGTLTRTPTWTGVLPADSAEAVALGIGAGKPVDGGSWAPTLLGQLDPGVRAHFYASAVNQVKKPPAAFTAEAPAMTVTKKITAVNPANGLAVEVKGTGFRGVTNPGDAGIYAGIAEAGGLPDVSSPEGMAAFAAVGYLPAASLATGAFTTNLTAPTNKLDPAKSYAIYTWQAHTHSSTSQDTVTALPINFAQLTTAPSAAVSIPSATPAGGVNVQLVGSGFAAVTNPGDAGVYVGVAEAGGLPDVSSQEGQDAFVASDWVMPAQITGGGFTKTLNLPTSKLDPAKTYAAYTWQAHSHSNTGQDTETTVPIDFATITGTPAMTVTGATTARYGTSPKYVVSVPGQTGAVQVKRNGAVVTSVNLVNGTATWTVPSTWSVGTHNLAFRFPGGTLLNEVTKPQVLTISKAATKVGASVVRKATAKKAGRVAIAVAPVTGGPASVGKIVVTFKKGKVTKKLTKTLVNGKVSFNLPKVPKGTWVLKVTYQGSTVHLPVGRSWNIKVAKK